MQTPVAEMELMINGESRRFEIGGSLARLIETLGLDPRKVAIERNLEIVPRSAYAATALCEGDRLEIVHFVGGG